ncbi:hypothetical protein OUZ56_001509 [Daphnia magna]|uniref:Uncharacterized protein n=1 Tax=Daphnia magna TaxID=35525 RepID=A0ABR0A3G4_9CRUS|nr:hypothetical protein OUZ56_001509 [Daphnia magna]
MEGKEKQGRTFLLKENRLLFHATGEIKSWSTVEQSPVDLSNAILIDHRLGPKRIEHSINFPSRLQYKFDIINN